MLLVEPAIRSMQKWFELQNLIGLSVENQCLLIKMYKVAINEVFVYWLNVYVAV